jgi:Spy/CpxP family protein refolding chaperone
MEEVAKDLNLTDEQKESLKPIFQAQAENVKELRTDTNLTRKQKIEKFKTIRDEIAPKVKEILTPEQFAKWERTSAPSRRRPARRAAKSGWFSNCWRICCWIGWTRNWNAGSIGLCATQTTRTSTCVAVERACG